MSWLRNNIATVMVAVTVGVFAELYGGMRGSVLPGVMPWLSALLLEVMLFFPHQRTGETTGAARLRVWEGLRCDPLVRIVILFLALLAIPFTNYGLCPSCDAAAIASGFDAAPPISFLPYCVNRSHHLTVFLWFLPTLIAVIAMRHALGRDEKRNVLEILVWNGAVLAEYGFIQEVAGAPGPLWSDYGAGSVGTYFFSTFGYPNAGGDYFAALFAVSIGLWRYQEETVRKRILESKGPLRLTPHQIFWRKHYHLIASFLLFSATITTLSRAAILLILTASAVLALHAGRAMLARLTAVQRLKMRARIGFGLVAVALAMLLFTPLSVRRELATLGVREVLDRVSRPSEYHTRVAMELFWDHPLFGCGGWGYAHLSPTKMTEQERKMLIYDWTTGTANVHNDYLQFLCELGLVGCGCLVVIAWLLVAPVFGYWRRRAKEVRFMTVSAPPSPRALFALPAGAFAVLVAALITLLHAFGDCPMRSPAVLSLFFVELAGLDGFLPHHATVFGTNSRKRRHSRRFFLHRRHHRHHDDDT